MTSPAPLTQKGSTMNKHTLMAAAACTALFGAAAQASTVQQELTHHAAQQSRIAADQAHGRVAPRGAGSLHERAATVERDEADALAGNDAASLQQLTAAERDLDHAIARAEHATAQQHATSLDRMHARVAGAREAEQQHWIATELRHGKLDAA